MSFLWLDPFTQMPHDALLREQRHGGPGALARGEDRGEGGGRFAPSLRAPHPTSSALLAPSLLVLSSELPWDSQCGILHPTAPHRPSENQRSRCSELCSYPGMSATWKMEVFMSLNFGLYRNGLRRAFAIAATLRKPWGQERHHDHSWGSRLPILQSQGTPTARR